MPGYEHVERGGRRDRTQHHHAPRARAAAARRRARAARRGRRARRRRRRRAGSGTWCSWTARSPASWCEPRCCARSATTRTRARSRCSSRAPTGCRSAATTTASRAPGSPWQALRYERQLELKHELVDDALRRIGHLDGFELEPIVPAAEPWRYRNKMEYSFGDLRGRNARARVPRARALGRGRRRARLHARVRAQQRGPQPGPRLVRGARPGRDGPPHAGGASCATSSCARAGGPASCRCASSRRRASSSTRSSVRRCCAAHPGADVLWTRTNRLAEVTQGGDTEVLAGSAVLHEELCDLRFRISPEAFFQTNTETAELLYGLARDYAQLTGQRARATTSTAASGRSAWRSPCAPARCGAWTSCTRRSPTRSRTRA